MWKEISPEERTYWDGMAAREKERYQAEIEVYDGPVSVNRFRFLLFFLHSEISMTLTLVPYQWEVSSKRAKKVSRLHLKITHFFHFFSYLKSFATS